MNNTEIQTENHLFQYGEDWDLLILILLANKVKN